ncbi:hemerythrin domain-containing protein [Streptomyces sp. NPDC051662]|uniref:hemerythrin domain-containing protein n=1 Tax=Streptomyces sp. NPDC051662 TaxID=3154750 RepID=UPI003448D6BE
MDIPREHLEHLNSLEPDGRLTALGNQLIETHMWLREELAGIRADLAAARPPGPGTTRQLRAHCLAFCSALSRHHTDEDDVTFPALAARHPELRPVLELLHQDHQVVSGILRSVEELLQGAADAAADGTDNAPRVLGELDGLSALLESHFTYEEKRIVTALNALAGPDGHGS